VIAPGFQAPRAWRGSLGVSHRFFRRYTLALDASYARGVAQTGAVDLNLNATPKLTLADEGNRPVYVSAGAIAPLTGVLSQRDSRRDAGFGRVNEITSTLHSETEQATLTFNTFAFGGLLLNASYTYTHSRDQAYGFGANGFGGFGGTTAGNPNVAEWGRSDLERTHNFGLALTYPLTTALEITAIGHLTSGPSYTPMVGSDVNGDGVANDRAFIFSPALAADTAVANGMTRLLASAPARVRSCIEAQMGTIAGRNSCSSSWQSSLDMQLNIKPSALGLDRRLTVSVQALNVLAGLDQLVHGTNHLRGWGQPVLPDRTLLYVRGFDPGTGAFQYSVNEHFGAATGAQSPFRIPFQLAIQARLTLGSDPARQNMRMVLRGANGGPPTFEEIRERMARAVPDPFSRIIAINDSAGLALTAEQIVRLHALSDSLHIAADPILDSLAATLAQASTKNPDPQYLGMKLRPKIEAARRLAAQAIKQAESVLTPEQWAKVPQSIKMPFRPYQERGPGRPGGMRRMPGNGGPPGDGPPT
jgi:hypothetical protein